VRDELGELPDEGANDDPDGVTPGVSVEDAEDALLEGDRTIATGTARAALAYPVFRTVYIGSLLSNIGSWMQNVVTAAFAYDLTRDPTVVSIVSFSQLGALLLLSLVGGALADRFDRKMLLILVSIEQAFFSLVLAWIARGSEPSIAGLVLVTAAIGIGQAIYAPTYSALLPILVKKRDLAGAVSLNSANMNLSRVVGPAIGAFAYAKVGASWVFVANALTYAFIIGALLMVKLPPAAPRADGEETGLKRVVEGFKVAANDRVIKRCLVTMATFSLLALPFVVQMPTLAAVNFGIEPKSFAYGLLYAAFGLGALIGALSIGTFLAGHSLETIVRLGLGGFSLALATFALLRNSAPAYPMAIIVGFCYFATVTSLSTVLQKRLDDSVRGRVMAIWVMAFGGAVAIGGLIAGPVIEWTSVTAVTLFGAVVAALLIFYADLRDPDPT
jgi:predicted MFS family arabinose efflux permease